MMYAVEIWEFDALIEGTPIHQQTGYVPCDTIEEVALFVSDHLKTDMEKDMVLAIREFATEAEMEEHYGCDQDKEG